MEDQEPELESLSLILNALTLQLQEKIRKINNAKKIEVAFKKNLKKAFKKPDTEELGDTGSGAPKTESVSLVVNAPNVLQSAHDDIVQQEMDNMLSAQQNFDQKSSSKNKAYVDYESDHNE
jgi:hypothetical protein